MSYWIMVPSSVVLTRRTEEKQPSGRCCRFGLSGRLGIRLVTMMNHAKENLSHVIDMSAWKYNKMSFDMTANHHHLDIETTAHATTMQ